MRKVMDGLLYFFGIGENPIPIHLTDDAQSIRSDWENIGNDLRNAFAAYGEAR